MKKLKAFLLIALFIPIFVHANLSLDWDNAKKEWDYSSELIEKLNSGSYGLEEQLQLIQNARSHCQEAKNRCSSVLKRVKDKQDKNKCKNLLKQCDEREAQLVAALQYLYVEKSAQQQSAVMERWISLANEQYLHADDLSGPARAKALQEVIAYIEKGMECYNQLLLSASSRNDLYQSHLDKLKNQILQVLNSHQQSILFLNQEISEINKVTEILKNQLKVHREELSQFQAMGILRQAYEIRKKMAPILNELVDRGVEPTEELTKLQNAIAVFEEEADLKRLTEERPLISYEEFWRNEKKRIDLFFKDLPLNSETFSRLRDLQKPSYPLISSLDHQKQSRIYTGQYYRYLVQNDSIPSHLLIKVHDHGQQIYEERISISSIAENDTDLKYKYGLDLRLSVIKDFVHPFALLITQKANDANYDFNIFLEGSFLYELHFSEPPPYQLEALLKPRLAKADRPLSRHTAKHSLNRSIENNPFILELASHQVLDQFVEEMNRDPEVLTQFVYNEIELDDPFLIREDGVFKASPIRRSAFGTFLDKRGSQWEQCALLIYLLRKAGFQAVYIESDPFKVPASYMEKLLSIELPGETESLVNYPGVLFINGDEWITLFPWMKEMQSYQGYDLYGFLSDEFANGHLWIKRYLSNDEQILKHIGPDNNDTVGVLFTRFVEEELRKRGLSFQDIGKRSQIRKKQFVSWGDFHRPEKTENLGILENLISKEKLFATMQLEISSQENPHKKLEFKPLFLADINCAGIALNFSPSGTSNHLLHVHFLRDWDHEVTLLLDQSDLHLDVKVSFFTENQSFSISKGTMAVLCHNLGSANPKTTTLFSENFAKEEGEEKRLAALLSFIGALYFEKCADAETALSNLHHVPSRSVVDFGLVKLSPDLSSGPLIGKPDLKFPQVDMVVYNHVTPFHYNSTDHMQLAALVNADRSSNEHQVLKEVFQDPYAISTVKLLQIAHLEHQKKGLEGTGFLTFSIKSFEDADRMPEAALYLYFSNLKNLNLRKLKNIAGLQWMSLKESFKDPFAYAYMTPGLISSQDGNSPFYQGMGTFIVNSSRTFSLISDNKIVLNGGYGSRLPDGRIDAIAAKDWNLVHYLDSFTLQQTPTTANKAVDAPTQHPQIKTDVRQEFKWLFDTVADPVDVVNGAFYIDEVDLELAGPFPLQVRRNYNSQNPIPSVLGWGWKLSLNPHLIEEEDLLYAAEQDGTIICYRYHPENSRWGVNPEDNPDLKNFNQKGIGGLANPFQAYVEQKDGYVLHGSDGSIRIYENNLLKKWSDSTTNSLNFIYRNDQLTRIESSNGNFLGFYYNHEGKIAESYAKDGRRIYYSYDTRGNLSKVILPNGAAINYEYDRFHRVIRETRPHGKVIENIYDDAGRIYQQRSPIGFYQQLCTSATFSYFPGITTVEDATGGLTEYRIFQNQIYKIIDPEGHQTLQSWFIDEKTWFDAETEELKSWDQPGAWPRSLKTTKDKRGLETHHLYDKRGNPTKIELSGNDISSVKEIEYNERNLPEKVSILDHTTASTTYDPLFPYLIKRIENSLDGQLLSFVEMDYDEHGRPHKENCSGAITTWDYDSRGFPKEQQQETGTDDPDVVTLFRYNDQGQCVEKQTQDAIYKDDYDIMGNRYRSQVFDLSGTLLRSWNADFDLNNEMLWEQGADPQNIIYYDYNASGLLKASRRQLKPIDIAYSLYYYDESCRLIYEVDPLGYAKEYTYDLLGRVKTETKEGYTITFSYEPGGLVSEILSPRGGLTQRFYYTNGLLAKETYPDGTEKEIAYDIFGRPILETENGMEWETRYNDKLHQVARTHLKSGISEISTFDERGNLICLIDPEGKSWEKSYDGLNRLKSEIDPLGHKTIWEYQGDRVYCNLPSGEKIMEWFVAGSLVERLIYSADNELLSQISTKDFPEQSVRQEIQGDIVTTTWTNTLGQPLKVQRGGQTTLYEYDAVGNCVAMTDGEGRVTRLGFDPWRRLANKTLPDGAYLTYEYDADSNLSACHLPGKLTWSAFHDLMGRKKTEELQADGQISNHWEYTYEKGLLKEAKDPLGRVLSYTYDLLGRLSEESIGKESRIYSYDFCGRLKSAEQFGDNHSLVERSYDDAGKLISENIYLNSQLLQATKQTWGTSDRLLEIGDHKRSFTYHNGRLKSISSANVELSYPYGTSGILSDIRTPCHRALIEHDDAAMPSNIETVVLGQKYLETMKWDHSGKLVSHRNNSFSYSSRGFLKSAPEGFYDFDYGNPGQGIRTLAPQYQIPPDGTDPFGKIHIEKFQDSLISTVYDEMGQVYLRSSLQGKEEFTWDCWGRLIGITSDSYTWKTSYDALGRRLQTIYTPKEGKPYCTQSFYDPEEEFQEIGTKQGDKVIWKIYGPKSCDAVLDHKGESASLVYDALDNLVAVATSNQVVWLKDFPGSYGPLSVTTSEEESLLGFAQGLVWQSKAVDPTGLIWFGARYYDPRSGRFLSPDPIGYPVCLDLYAYANGDPINNRDPDGRFASAAYQTVKPLVIDTLFNPRVQGALRATGGFVEMNVGMGTLGICPPLGGFLIAHGIDNFQTGMNQAITGYYHDPLTVQLFEKTGMSHNAAHMTNDFMGIIGTMSGAALQIAKAACTGFILPKGYGIGNESAETYAESFMGHKGSDFKNANFQPLRNSSVKINGRLYSGHALDQMQNRGITPSVVENTLKIGEIRLDPKIGRLRYYDPTNNVTFIIEKSTQEIVTAMIGER